MRVAEPGISPSSAAIIAVFLPHRLPRSTSTGVIVMRRSSGHRRAGREMRYAEAVFDGHDCQTGVQSSGSGGNGPRSI